MTVNLAQFRQAALSDASRLELNSKETGLHRKGWTNGGKVVEWIRDVAGLRTNENRKVMKSFVSALRAEYGNGIASQMEGRLGRTVGDGKPLSARTAREVIKTAGQLRTTQLKNNALASDYSHGGPQDRLSGYMTTAVSVGKTLGVSDALVGKLFDASHPKVIELRSGIAEAIRKLGGNEPTPVSPEAARDVAEKAITRFLCKTANAEKLEKALGAGDSSSPAQKQIAEFAREIGLPGLSGALSKPGSTEVAAFLKSALIPMSSEKVDDDTFVQRVISARINREVIEQAVATGQAKLMTSLSKDPKQAVETGRLLMSEAFGPKGNIADRPIIAGLINREIERLAAEGPEGVTAARDLQLLLLSKYDSLGDSSIKADVLTRERDFHRNQARDNGSERSWFTAASFQNDLIALHLADVGKPKTAQSGSKLDALALQSPELADAMDELNSIEREYIRFQGGDPSMVSLDWKSARNELAQLRTLASSIPSATGTELQAYIAAKMRGLTATLMANAVAVLGPPPARMAVISLGSASRGEASPYSDVEFGIVLEKPADQAMKDYTRKFSELIR
ncbi:MAG TPA: DUF294 nucleotidyltransferase-like domain-containing protein, partial [Caulifigura sp.]|nr:DUF294 nucleotidyltransferase-like domain-containing protein [Caulifigura sp.]